MTIDTARCETCKGTGGIRLNVDSPMGPAEYDVCPDCAEPAPSAGVSEARLLELIANRNLWYGRSVNDHEDIAVALRELLSTRSRIAELEAGVDDALGTLIGCCIPAGGVDDRKAMLDCQVRLRALLPKESDNG